MLPRASKVNSGSLLMRAAWLSFVPIARAAFRIVGPCQYSSFRVPEVPRPAPVAVAGAAAAGLVGSAAGLVGSAAAGLVGSAAAGPAGSAGPVGRGVAVGAAG